MQNELHTDAYEEAILYERSPNFNLQAPSFENLDSPITTKEVYDAVKRLKRDKSASGDHLINKYFIESLDIICSHLVDLFNAVFDSGYFPDKWSQGIIVPIFKKNDPSDVNNYRGITLVSCFAKLFTGILNRRISNWCEHNHVLSDAQFGFRTGRSTVDAIFVLNAVVNKVLTEKGRLYCAFVDLKKAFDSVNLTNLWFKLYRHGLDGKLFTMIKSMYSHVKACVKACNTYSDFFECAVGLKQGEVMSPLLFSLFIDDLELFLQDSPTCGISIDDVLLILLLFADDMVILGNSTSDLQTRLDLLKTYCDRWGLVVNVDKTKIVVFRKRGGLRLDEKWDYNGLSIDTVDSFNYLGTVFYYTGNFNCNVNTLAGKALKALNVLTLSTRKYPIKYSTLFQLFDAFVGSILHYSCEIWGFGKFRQLERVHLKFCKQLLNVSKSTCSIGVYGELRRFPLYITRHTRIIKYWCKVLRTDNIIVQYLYNDLLKKMQ